MNGDACVLFEYHTFLHHSQTEIFTRSARFLFEYHTFLHHSQTDPGCPKAHKIVWVPYIFTSFSNMEVDGQPMYKVWVPYIFTSFSNAFCSHCSLLLVWVPYIFTSFSNRRQIGTLTAFVWVPYIFTSFSNYATKEIKAGEVWVPYIFTSFSNLKFKNELLSSAQNRYSNIRWILIDITSIFVNYIIFSLIRKVPLYIFYEKQGYFIVACHLGEFVYLCFVQIGSNID